MLVHRRERTTMKTLDISELCEKSLIEAQNSYKSSFTFDTGFRVGFYSAFQKQQKKLETYAAYVNGSITRSELDQIIGEE